MCSPQTRKEANLYYWIVKGSLIPDGWSDREVEGIHESYFKRIWGNHENGVHTDGFEFAYKMRMDTPDDLEKVAILGGHYD